MDVKINREIRQYTESVFMGLDMRQLLCSAASVSSAAAAYFLLRGKLGAEAVSWICILSAFPFAALGFISYNGMSAGKLLLAWLRSGAVRKIRLNGAGDCVYRKLFRPEDKRRKRCSDH